MLWVLNILGKVIAGFQMKHFVLIQPLFYIYLQDNLCLPSLLITANDLPSALMVKLVERLRRTTAPRLQTQIY